MKKKSILFLLTLFFTPISFAKSKSGSEIMTSISFILNRSISGFVVTNLASLEALNSGIFR